MVKDMKTGVDKIHALIEKEIKKAKKDDKHEIDDVAIEKAIKSSLPLKRQKNTDPNKPKRPLSNYMLFAKDIRPKLKKEHPTMSVVDTMVMIGKKWSALTQAQKDAYKSKK